MKVYIAGKIIGEDNYKKLFKKAENDLLERGYRVINPATLPLGFEHHEYMHICYAMIDVCDAVFFLDNWKNSRGAMMEHDYANSNNKVIQYI